MPLLAAIAALALAQQSDRALIRSPESRFQMRFPLAGISGEMIDTYSTDVGVAQETARAKGLQGRVLWIDGTANLDRTNSEEKIVQLLAKIKGVGFNTIVFDVKPISGQTLYPSKFAPKLTEWRGQTLPAEFDPLAIMSREARKDGLSLLVSLNAFSEGHNLFRVGPGYLHPDWQTVIYDWQPMVQTGLIGFPLGQPFNKMTEGEDHLGVFSDPAKLPRAKTGEFTVTVRRDGHVQDGFEDGGATNTGPTIPTGGYALCGAGEGAAWMRAHLFPGQAVKLEATPLFVPVGERPELQYPLMVNPNDPEVQRYELGILNEVAGKYDVDGILYDDRFRYAGIYADFSETTHHLFEQYLGKTIRWPVDVFEFTITPSLGKGIKPGPYYDAWMAWRALQLQKYLVRARGIAQSHAKLLGLYVGSWYGEYPALGNNYASDQTEAPFWFLTPQYRKTGNASLLDLLIGGAYYQEPTIFQAMADGAPIGSTVEAATALVNRLARDQAWCYGGIQLSDFAGNPDGLARVLQAACASSQGVMVFDLSHDIEPMWPVFEQAFRVPRFAPHTRPKVLAQIRRMRASLDKKGMRLPPVIVSSGSSGVGQ